MPKKIERKINVGILGCGAIGAGIARYIVKHLHQHACLTAICDHHPEKVNQLAKELKKSHLFFPTVEGVISNSDLIVEAINSNETINIIRKILDEDRHILVMSVGKLIEAPRLVNLAAKKKLSLLLPSGAIAGIDAIKAGSLVGVKSLTLTTRKPVEGFKNDPYLLNKKINLNRVRTECVIFEGNVKEAVKAFPRNINVAATLALAANAAHLMKVRIIASKTIKRNTHHIEMKGDFGKITSITENVICPDNPKTSYLAVLSAIQTLKQYVTGINVGT